MYTFTYSKCNENITFFLMVALLDIFSKLLLKNVQKFFKNQSKEDSSFSSSWTSSFVIDPCLFRVASLSPLQNSPLFQYLQDLGHTDFEACSPVSQEEESSAGGEEAPFPQDILPSHKVSVSTYLSNTQTVQWQPTISEDPCLCSVK